MKRTKKLTEMINFLGRKPRNRKEYTKIYRFMYQYNDDYKDRIKIQQRRHLSHTGPANIRRKPCIFCEI